MDFLSDNIEKFNEVASTAVEQFAMLPQEFSAGIYEMVVGVNGALVPFAMALLITYYIFSFYDKAVNFKLNDYKVYVGSLISLAIGLIVLENNLSILQIFYMLNNTILNKIGASSTYVTIIDAEILTELFNSEEVNVFTNTFSFVMMFFAQIVLIIVSWIASAVVQFTVLSRMFEIYVLLAFAPIAMCSFSNDTTRGIGKNYMTNFCAIVLKGSVIIFVLKLYNMYLIDNALTMTGTGWAYIINAVISALMMIMLILGAEKLSKVIIGTLK